MRPARRWRPRRALDAPADISRAAGRPAGRRAVPWPRPQRPIGRRRPSTLRSLRRSASPGFGSPAASRGSRAPVRDAIHARFPPRYRLADRRVGAAASRSHRSRRSAAGGRVPSPRRRRPTPHRGGSSPRAAGSSSTCFEGIDGLGRWGSAALQRLTPAAPAPPAPPRIRSRRRRPRARRAVPSAARRCRR